MIQDPRLGITMYLLPPSHHWEKDGGQTKGGVELVQILTGNVPSG